MTAEHVCTAVEFRVVLHDEDGRPAELLVCAPCERALADAPGFVVSTRVAVAS